MSTISSKKSTVIYLILFFILLVIVVCSGCVKKTKQQQVYFIENGKEFLFLLENDSTRIYEVKKGGGYPKKIDLKFICSAPDRLAKKIKDPVILDLFIRGRRIEVSRGELGPWLLLYPKEKREVFIFKNNEMYSYVYFVPMEILPFGILTIILFFLAIGSSLLVFSKVNYYCHEEIKFERRVSACILIVIILMILLITRINVIGILFVSIGFLLKPISMLIKKIPKAKV